MNTLKLNQKIDLYEYLKQFVSKNKVQKIEEYIQYRTRYITIVLEDIFQPQNASAVLRTCECLGIQDVHIIENRYKYELNPDVELGSSKWLTLMKYNQNIDNSLITLNKLKSDGYKIVATSPNKNNILINDLPVNNKLAMFFGTEKEGLSNYILQNADYYVKIPMYGFMESYNLSVSVAITAYTIINKLKKSKLPWKLSLDESYDIRINWLKNIIRMSDLIIKDYMMNLKSN